MDGLNQSTSPSLELVKTALDKLLDEAKLGETRYGKADATDAVVFTQDTASNAAVITEVIGGGGYFDSTTDDVTGTRDAAIKAPTPKTTLILQFKKNLPISRTFMADQQLSAVAKVVRKQVKTWVASRDRNAISKYYNGFGTQLTIDGKALFANDHVNENGDTVDNLETAAMSDTGLNTLVNSLRTQKNQEGVVIGYEPDFLLTSSVLHKDGMATAKSVLRAGTGNNDLNYWSEMYPGMRVLYSPHFDTSGVSNATTMYAIGSAGHSVTRFVREAFFTDLVGWETNENDQYIYKMRAREQVDTIEYVGLAGSNGSA